MKYLAVSIFFTVFTTGLYNAPVKEPVKTINHLSLPAHGKISANISDIQIAPMQIKTEGGGYYLVKPESISNRGKYFMVFIHGGRTLGVRAPLGKYRMNFYLGQRWFGYGELFGERGSYNKSDDIFDFKITDNPVSGYTLTLYGVAAGNLEKKPISKDSF